MLNSHPNMSWAGEIFHDHHERADRTQSIAPFSFLQNKIDRSRSRHFGFETKFQHLDANGVDLTLARFHKELVCMGFSKVIVLKRTNYLRQAISVARGQLSGKWHVSVDSQNLKTQPIALDVDHICLGGRERTLVDCFRHLDQTYAHLEAILDDSKATRLNLTYEDHLEVDPLDGFHRVSDFIGLTPMVPQVSLQRIETRPVDEIVSNFQQIRSCLMKTEYEWMCSR